MFIISKTIFRQPERQPYRHHEPHILPKIKHHLKHSPHLHQVLELFVWLGREVVEYVPFASNKNWLKHLIIKFEEQLSTSHAYLKFTDADENV